MSGSISSSQFASPLAPSFSAVPSTPRSSGRTWPLAGCSAYRASPPLHRTRICQNTRPHSRAVRRKGQGGLVGVGVLGWSPAHGAGDWRPAPLKWGAQTPLRPCADATHHWHAAVFCRRRRDVVTRQDRHGDGTATHAAGRIERATGRHDGSAHPCCLTTLFVRFSARGGTTHMTKPCWGLDPAAVQPIGTRCPARSMRALPRSAPQLAKRCFHHCYMPHSQAVTRTVRAARPSALLHSDGMVLCVVASSLPPPLPPRASSVPMSSGPRYPVQRLASPPAQFRACHLNTLSCVYPACMHRPHFTAPYIMIGSRLSMLSVRRQMWGPRGWAHHTRGAHHAHPARALRAVHAHG